MRPLALLTHARPEGDAAPVCGHGLTIRPIPSLALLRPQLSIATAIVFYHRFYARESYESYERFQVATTCLFLASKVEETPKKLKDVILECYKVQHNTVQPPDPDSHDLHKLKEQVLVCERELLRVLGFDLSVEHAYRPLLAYIKSISGTRDLAQIAWNFINDSLRTTICLQYAPRCLAAAAAMMASNYLEAKLQKPCPLPAHPPGTGGKWYDAFQVREHTINEIVRLIQQMYDDNKSGGSVQLANSGAVAKMSMGAAAAANGSSKPSGGSSSVGGGKGEASSRDSNSDMTWGRSEGSERKRDSEREPTLKRGSSGDGAHSGGGAAASNAKADQVHTSRLCASLCPPASPLAATSLACPRGWHRPKHSKPTSLKRARWRRRRKSNDLATITRGKCERPRRASPPRRGSATVRPPIGESPLRSPLPSQPLRTALRFSFSRRVSRAF